MMRLTLLSLLLLMLALAGCRAALDLPATRNIADRFMHRMARGDIAGAYDLCDPNSVTLDTLQRIANNPRYADVFRNYDGMSHGDGGKHEQREEFTDVRLSPAKVLGEEGWVANFALRRYDDTWLVMAFSIDPDTETK